MKYLDENGLLYYTQKIKSWLSGKEDTSNKKTTLDNSATHYPSTSAVTAALNDKVDKVTGKGLSTNDYTTTEKNKLAGIASGAEVNVQADWNETNTSSDAFIKNKPTIPPSAVVDTAMSSSSTNAVQNKVIKAYVDNAIGGITQIEIVVVSTLPTASASTMNKIYLVPKSPTEAQNIKDEYITVQNGSSYVWEKIGDTAVDLSNYATKDFVKNDLYVTGGDDVASSYLEVQTRDGLDGDINVQLARWDAVNSLVRNYESVLNKVTSFGTTPSDTKYPSEKLVYNSLNNKVDKVTGKGLSTNDFTDDFKSNLFDSLYCVDEAESYGSKFNIVVDSNDGGLGEYELVTIDVLDAVYALKVNYTDLIAITNAEIDTICS